MNGINDFGDFIRLIDDSSSGGYEVCLSETSFRPEWTANHHIEHLLNVWEHSSETEIQIDCKSWDSNGRLHEVELHVHSSVGNPIEVNERTCWVIRYHDKDS